VAGCCAADRLSLPPTACASASYGLQPSTMEIETNSREIGRRASPTTPKRACYPYKFGKITKFSLQQLLKRTCYLSQVAIQRCRTWIYTRAVWSCYRENSPSLAPVLRELVLSRARETLPPPLPRDKDRSTSVRNVDRRPLLFPSLLC